MKNVLFSQKMLFAVYSLMFSSACSHQPLQIAENEDFGKKLHQVNYKDESCEGQYCIATREYWEHGMKFIRKNGEVAATYYYEK